VSITPEQCRAARRLLGWPQTVLAGKSGLGVPAISHFEKGNRRLSVLDVSTVRKVLEVGGVEFVGEAGARLRS
jgi:transcriptional regulator with XRE-family HTH domain